MKQISSKLEAFSSEEMGVWIVLLYLCRHNIIIFRLAILSVCLLDTLTKVILLRSLS